MQQTLAVGVLVSTMACFRCFLFPGQALYLPLLRHLFLKHLLKW